MTIRTRILFAVAGAVLPMALAVLAAYSSYAREHDASGALLSALERVIQAERADDALVDMRLALAARVVYRETAALARFEQSYARLVAELTRLEGLAAAEARAAGRIRGIRTAVEDWRRLEADAIIRAADAGREAEAMTRLRAARDGAQAARDALFGFIADERGVAEALGVRGARTHRMARTLMLSSVALVVAGGALAGWLLVRRLEALERARHEAESFVDVQRDLAETLDLGRILARIARHARVLCESDVSGIAICDPQSGAGTMVALDGARTDALFALRIEPDRTPGPLAAEGIDRKSVV